MGFALSSLQLRSNSIANGIIADRNTKAGGNLSPHLSWSEAPENTQAFALICHDPDAPRIVNGEYGFIHWVLYNIPAIDELLEGTDIGVAGINSFGDSGYGGPKPPPGHGIHHYFFILFALRSVMDLQEGLSAQKLLEQIEPEVLGMNRLVGTYEARG
ncbi:MAG TPA: YbhB/YbcL family Raf kinase inhibitor-like protein [Spongiibacteraceae bacterium]|jgi:hypothetical protein